MPAPLPIELEEPILHELGALCIEESKKVTLRACCLVCRRWVRTCQGYIMEEVRLYSQKHLEKMVEAMSSSTRPLASYVVKITLDPLGQSFHHLVPHFLATRLPSLRVVEYPNVFMAKAFKRSVFQCHQTLSMHLRHFRGVTSLFLSEYYFETFWELRRVVVSLPALEVLTLRDINWPSPFQEVPHHLPQRFPSLPFIALKLSEVNTLRCSLPWEVLWFWVSSRIPAVGHGTIAPDGELPYPSFTIQDGVTLRRIIQLLVPPWSEIKHQWSYDAIHRNWNFSSGDRGREIRLTIEARSDAKPPKLLSSPRLGKWIGCVHTVSVRMTSEREYLLEKVDWAGFDNSCDSLQDLWQVEIHLPSLEREILRHVARSMPLVRTRRGLSRYFIGHGESISWEDLGDLRSDADAEGDDGEGP